MKNKNFDAFNAFSGFVTGMFIFIIACIFISIGVGAYTKITKIDKDIASNNANDFAKNLGMDNANVVCVDMDTNDDGYVSCTVLNNKNGNILPIECAGFGFNSGCRLQKNFGSDLTKRP